jgi:hypothetical protein
MAAAAAVEEQSWSDILESGWQMDKVVRLTTTRRKSALWALWAAKYFKVNILR